MMKINKTGLIILMMQISINLYSQNKTEVTDSVPIFENQGVDFDTKLPSNYSEFERCRKIDTLPIHLNLKQGIYENSDSILFSFHSGFYSDTVKLKINDTVVFDGIVSDRALKSLYIKKYNSNIYSIEIEIFHNQEYKQFNWYKNIEKSYCSIEELSLINVACVEIGIDRSFNTNDRFYINLQPKIIRYITE